jgi:hypothetical protein
MSTVMFYESIGAGSVPHRHRRTVAERLMYHGAPKHGDALLAGSQGDSMIAIAGVLS